MKRKSEKSMEERIQDLRKTKVFIKPENNEKLIAELKNYSWRKETERVES